jgi:hypothetical protein
MKPLNFYKRPLVKDGYSDWVYDSKSNFVFQFELKNYDKFGKRILGVSELINQVIFSLNSLDHEPIEELSLSVNPNDPIQILNHGKLFITIRGWGNLTGIGGYNFDEEKASKIQDDFRDWIIEKLSKV